MGYYAQGEGSADRVDVQKARDFIRKHQEALGLNLTEETRHLELRFPWGKWYADEDFDGSPTAEAADYVARAAQDVYSLAHSA